MRARPRRAPLGPRGRRRRRRPRLRRRLRRDRSRRSRRRDAGARARRRRRRHVGDGRRSHLHGRRHAGAGGLRATTTPPRACSRSSWPRAARRPTRPRCGSSARRASRHFHWLEAHGVPFKRSFYPEPSMEAPTDDCLVFSGGEDAYPFDRLTPPVPRAHKPQHAERGGRLPDAAARRGNRAERRRDPSATRAPTRWSSSATAASPASSSATTAREHARSRAARRRARRRAASSRTTRCCAATARCSQRCSFRLGVEGDDGRAIRMAMGAGADVVAHARRRGRGADHAAAPSGPRHPRHRRGSALHQRGRLLRPRRPGRPLPPRRPHVPDRRHRDLRAEPRRLRGDRSSRRRSPTSSASPAFPTAACRRRSRSTTATPRAARIPSSTSTAQFLQPLTQAPFAADRLQHRQGHLGDVHARRSPHHARPAPCSPPTAQIIPGLYAAGRTTNGIAADGYVSGISLGDGTFFGRRAGRATAASRPRGSLPTSSAKSDGASRPGSLSTRPCAPRAEIVERAARRVDRSWSRTHHSRRASPGMPDCLRRLRRVRGRRSNASEAASPEGSALVVVPTILLVEVARRRAADATRAREGPYRERGDRRARRRSGARFSSAEAYEGRDLETPS